MPSGVDPAAAQRGRSRRRGVATALLRNRESSRRGLGQRFEPDRREPPRHGRFIGIGAGLCRVKCRPDQRRAAARDLRDECCSRLGDARRKAPLRRLSTMPPSRSICLELRPGALGERIGQRLDGTRTSAGIGDTVEDALPASEGAGCFARARARSGSAKPMRRRVRHAPECCPRRRRAAAKAASVLRRRLACGSARVSMRRLVSAWIGSGEGVCSADFLKARPEEPQRPAAWRATGGDRGRRRGSRREVAGPRPARRRRPSSARSHHAATPRIAPSSCASRRARLVKGPGVEQARSGPRKCALRSDRTTSA